MTPSTGILYEIIYDVFAMGHRLAIAHLAIGELYETSEATQGVRVSAQYQSAQIPHPMTMVKKAPKKKSSRTRIDAQKRGLGNHYNLARPYHRANETEEKNLAGGNGCWGPVGTLNFR